MAVDLQTLAMEASCDVGDANRKEAEPPPTSGGGAAEGEAVVVYKKGAWSKEEDEKLRRAVDKYGLRNWVAIEKFSGLGRPAKNCRLRWLNYLRPNLKKYPFTEEEEELIFELHSKYGNSWSRIASKLPGRSDNEIKNFWHKRSKKRHKHNLPIHPSTKQNHHQNPINHNTYYHHEQPDNAKDPKNDDVLTNYPNHTLIHSPQLQPHTPNIINISSHTNNDASIHSPQTVMSSHNQNPVNHLTDPTTPTSQTQNLLISPHPITQSTENPYVIPNPSPQGQNCQSSNAFTMLMKPPPILSSPQGRFSRATCKLSPISVPNAPSTILLQDSPVQMPFCSSAMESPRSPLKLNLSPRMPTFCSAQMNTQPTDSQVASLQSPHTVPLSPLKLRLSIPIPSESCFQSNVSMQASPVQLEPYSCGLYLPPTTPMAVDNDYNIPRDSTQAIKTEPPSIQVESDSSFEIMQELREAQARVRFLKKKLKLKQISDKTSSKITDLMEGPLDENSSESTSQQTTNSGTKNFLDAILRVKAPIQKNSRKRDSLKKIPKKGENSESKKYTEGSIESEKATCDDNSQTKSSLQRENYSLNDIFKREHSITFDEQNHSIDLFDHPNIENTVNALNSNSFDNKQCPFQAPAGKCSNERSTIDGLYNESSNLLQDSSLNRDLCGPVYSQSTTTTIHVKPGEHFGYSLGQHILDLETKFTENGLLSKSNVLQNQYLTADPLDSSYVVSAPIMEQEYFRDEQFFLQSCRNSDENSKANVSMHQTPATNLMHQTPAANLIDNLIDDSRYLVGFEEQVCVQGENYFAQEGCREQGLMQGLLEDNNLWSDGQLVSQDHIFNWNHESGCGHTGEILKHEAEHDHMNTMSEELSSLLDFFPTSNQTLAWYNVGNSVNDAKASDEFDMGINQQRQSSQQPLLTTSDYL